jgi:hypothetical protein
LTTPPFRALILVEPHDDISAIALSPTKKLKTSAMTDERKEEKKKTTSFCVSRREWFFYKRPPQQTNTTNYHQNDPNANNSRMPLFTESDKTYEKQATHGPTYTHGGK